METGSNNQPVGLYRHIITGTFIGAIDETQANAFKGLGYELVEGGIDAAKLTEEEIATKFGTKANAGGETYEPTKKGK